MAVRRCSRIDPRVTAPEADRWIGTLLAGRYRVERALSSGGMGSVYAAVHEHIGREVAVKILHPALATEREHVVRFRREAETAARLVHPHIVQVTDVGIDPPDPPFLVMELLDGDALTTVIRREGALEPARAVRITRQVLSALAAAHAAGVVHRDMKPPNVLLVRGYDGAEIAKVVDFGVAKLMDSSGYTRLTATGRVLGTARFMAPEQLAGGTIDGRIDVYAVGVLLYCMLAGSHPFGGSEAQAIEAILAGRYESLAARRPGLDPDLVRVVDRAMARDFADRYETADAMARALAPHERHVAAPAPAKTDDLERPAGVVPAPRIAPPPETRAAPVAPLEHGRRAEARRSRSVWLLVVALASGIFGAAAVGGAFFALDSGAADEETDDATTLAATLPVIAKPPPTTEATVVPAQHDAGDPVAQTPPPPPIEDAAVATSGATSKVAHRRRDAGVAPSPDRSPPPSDDAAATSDAGTRLRIGPPPWTGLRADQTVRLSRGPRWIDATIEEWAAPLPSLRAHLGRVLPAMESCLEHHGISDGWGRVEITREPNASPRAAPIGQSNPVVASCTAFAARSAQWPDGRLVIVFHFGPPR